MAKPLMIDGAKFTWPKGTKSGSAEISDLNLGGWPQSFFIKSHKTGETMLFLPGDRITQGQGEDEELGGYTYFNPGGDVTVTIWND